MPSWETLHMEKMKLSPDRQFIIQTENSIKCPMQEVRLYHFSNLRDDDKDIKGLYNIAH